jgi:uncharacterized protein (DUF849 family)
MKTRIDKARLNRATIYFYYYLGVTDGISAALESFKGLSHELPKDAKWRVEFRMMLASSLA